MQHFPVPENESSDSTKNSPKENPQSKIEDEKRSSFNKSGGQKAEPRTMSQNSKADGLDKDTK